MDGQGAWARMQGGAWWERDDRAGRQHLKGMADPSSLGSATAYGGCPAYPLLCHASFRNPRPHSSHLVPPFCCCPACMLPSTTLALTHPLLCPHFAAALPCLQVIAEHLFHEGLFEIGQLFVQEAGVAGGEELKQPYASMHTVLQEVRV